MSLPTAAQRRKYAAALRGMDDDAFLGEAFEQIDLANQSPVYSKDDDLARLCWEEARRRGRLDLYERAFTAAYRVAKGDQQYAQAFDALHGSVR